MTTPLRPGDYAMLADKKVVIVSMKHGVARVAFCGTREVIDTDVKKLSPVAEGRAA